MSSAMGDTGLNATYNKWDNFDGQIWFLLRVGEGVRGAAEYERERD